jgi:hypothetical protein
VKKMIEVVQKTGEDRIVFLDGKLVAVLAGDCLGMYEVQVADNPRVVATGSK